jgi:dienelactone hydrolase
LLPDLKGFKAALRRWYWGFDAKQFPLNGRVWFPDSVGPFPLVLIVHGNHTMEQFSDPGYAYLGELLASRGFITVSVDENFLNGSWSGDLRGKELPARGWMLLEHLKVWRSWNEQAGNLFYHKVDLNNIALIGHSRGGEAVAVAAAFNRLSRYPEDANLKFDFNFAIKSLIAIAPSDEHYKPAGQPVAVENVNYFVLHGGHDSDVSAFLGSRQYQRVKFSDADYHFKSILYIYRANHGQFNTEWGINDWGEPFGPLLNYKPLLAGAEQRQIAKVYIAAFLAATLRGERAYVPLFRDQRTAAAWLPSAVCLSRFRDSQFKVVSDYEEDIDLSTTTAPGGKAEGERLKVWREERLRLRSKDESNQNNNVVRLGWEKAGTDSAPAEYRLTLPDGLAQQWHLNAEAKLCFALANAGEKQEPVEVTLELASADGVKASLPLSRFAQLSPPLTIQFSKLRPLENLLLKPAELVPQTFELPLADFVDSAPDFDPAKLKTITFLLDNSHDGAIILDEVGFSL